MHAVNITNQDQNRLCGLPLDSWRTYPFPTIDGAIRFAINCALNGPWECKYDGILIRRTIGESNLAKSLRAQPQGKSLRPKKSLRPEPQRPAFHKVPENTEWLGNTIRTTMADGLELVWDTCGACSQFALKCACRDGITAPRYVEYIATKTYGYTVDGQKWEDVDTAKRVVDTGPQKFVQPWRENRPTTTPAPAPKGKSLRAVVQAPTMPVRKSLRDYVPTDTPKPNGKPLRPAQPVPEEPTIVVTEDFQLSSLDSAAEAHADSLTKQLTRVTKSLTKSLPRKTLPGNKLPRKA